MQRVRLVISYLARWRENFSKKRYIAFWTSDSSSTSMASDTDTADKEYLPTQQESIVSVRQ